MCNSLILVDCEASPVKHRCPLNHKGTVVSLMVKIIINIVASDLGKGQIYFHRFYRGLGRL